MNAAAGGNVVVDASVFNGIADIAQDWRGASVALRLLGGFELRVASRLALLPLTAERLVAFVALCERPTPRRVAANSLWAHGTEGRAAGCLRSALWRIRLLPAPLIVAECDRLSVAPNVCVDISQARSFAAAITENAVSFDSATVRRLLATDVLPHWYDDWLLLQQEQFRILRLHALETAAMRFAQRGRYLEGLDTALSAVAADPLRESAHRIVMRIHLMEGNYSEALRQFNTYAQVLRRDLGVEPSPRIEQLVKLARGRPAVGSAYPLTSDCGESAQRSGELR
jgi:DNA-binding SARP family transcriptional activator